MTASKPKTTSDSVSPWRAVFSIDPRSLALFRVLIALVLLYDLALRAEDLATMYGPEGVLPIDSVRAYFRAAGLPLNWSLYHLHSSLAFQASLFAVSAAFAVALLVGYRTHLASIGSWVLLASLHGRTPNLVNGGDMLLASLLLWGLFLPLGARWSLDVRSGRTRRLNRPVFSVATVAILLQMFVMYFCTGLSKLNGVWLSGEALYNALSFDMFVTPLGDWLLNYPVLLTVLTHLTLWGELICPLLLFVPWGRPYPRAIALLFFAGLHVGIEFTMTVAVFSVASLAGLSLFLPSEFWRSRYLTGAWLAVRRVLPRVMFRHARPRPAGWIASQLSRPWAIRARDGLCLILLAFMLAWNLSTTTCAVYEHQTFLTNLRSAAEEQPPDGAPQPGPFVQAANALSSGTAPIAEMLHLNARWDMFAAPVYHEYRFIARAQLANGEEVDVLRDAAVVEVEDLEELRPTEPNVRWMLHYMGLTGPRYGWFAQDTAEYLRRQWDAAHDESRRIESLALVMVRKRPQDDDLDKLTIAEIGPEPGSWIQRHESGRVAARGPYRHGVRHGYWKHWREDGQLDGEGPYVEGVKQGEWTLWDDPDGTFHKGKGMYVAGEMNGPWVYWHANGQKAAAGKYRRGKKHGTWTWWYDNGQLDHQGAYHNGLEHGMFTFWDRNGIKEGEGAYQNGLEDGKWVFYETNGVQRIVQYRDGQLVDFEFRPD